MRYRTLFAALSVATFAACSSGAPPPFVQSEARTTGAPPAAALHSSTFTLDNVALTFTSRLPAGSFAASSAGAGSQMAWAMEGHPMRMVDIEAIPYGFGSPLEANLVAVPGIAASQRQALAMRHANAAHVLARDVPAVMFGQQVSGAAYIDADAHANGGYRAVAHFVAEAGSRLWQININEDMSASETATFIASLAGLSLTSSAPDRPTTMTHEQLPPRGQSRMQSPPLSVSAPAEAARTPMSYTGWNVQNPPSWWVQQPNTPCDYEHYWLNTPSSVPAAFQLYSGYDGVSNPWHGLVACGPNPYKYANADVLTTFYSGAWGAYEWECVELSLRWMWQAYGVQPYSANGNSIASNYNASKDGGNVQYIANGGYPPLPVMGDVLQYSGGTYGHTSVVTYETHNSSGTGYLTVIEQNNGNYAGNKLNETNWYVNCASDGSGCPTAWLHRP